MNILILSAGTRNNIIRYFREAIKGNGLVVAADMSPLAPAIYEADKYYIVQGITNNGYIGEILDICKKEKINGVLSLIDPELSLLAKHRREFENVGTVVIGSDYDVCEMSFDKMQTYRFCMENGFQTALSWCGLEEFKRAVQNKEVEFPVIVKPRFGSASIGVYKAKNMETVELLWKYAGENDRIMIQEYLPGVEIGADAYIDMISGEVVSVFTKKKILMRAGETDKSVSFKDEKLFALIKKFARKAGYKGPIDIDLFDNCGKYYILEVNPRIGGGYPHAHECGVDFMELLCNNLNKKENINDIGNYKDGVYMMKYNEVSILQTT